MAEIRPLSMIRDKWTRVTPGRMEDYKIGIQNPRRDWAEEASAAKDIRGRGLHSRSRLRKRLRSLQGSDSRRGYRTEVS